MSLRLVKKAILLTVRSKKRFIPFTIIYTVLIFWMSFNFEQIDEIGVQMVAVSALATIITSFFYVRIILSAREKEIATFKCIGWTNKDIQTVLFGEILFVVFCGFFIIAEILIHHAAITSYYWHQNMSMSDAAMNGGLFWERTMPFLSIPSLFWTLLLFLGSQSVAIWWLFRKIGKLRPIVALRVMK